MQPRYCGIDFGTSNSTVAIADDDSARLIPLEAGEPTLPSAVFWETDGGPPQFGRAAIRAYVEGDDGRLMRGLKSTLGSSLIHEKTRVGRQALSFRDVVARFIGHLKAEADAATGGIDRVVLGRPVHFVDGDAEGDRAAQAVLEEIALAAGFREVAFQFEPIAAALHYEQSVTQEELVLIFDIGGGTSDFSIVRVSPERARAADRQADILANDGIRVGGTDFDRLLSLAEVMPHLGFGSTTRQGQGNMPRHFWLDLATWHRINMLYAPRTMSDLKALRRDADSPDLLDRMIRVIEARAGHALAMEAESAKIALSESESTRLALREIAGAPNPVVTRGRFEQAVDAPVARVRDMIGSVLVQAGLAESDITTVFLTGGSSRLPVLRGAVAAALPDAHMASGDMLGSVGTGLAVDARRRFR
ncbi:Hsp70 family protein [Falsirhodobacter xinxiangensis]|uniref:Hsp70 family protein n=1 Tax=Falsirhodobacter xinxiangensis TaxID=2530049 RepID=UPI0010AAB94F|nr:Hsp70 family protein [Rhodobacter xinxiangensis]